jgi:hypothetical protein
MKVIEVALRDTCVKAYRRSYDKVAEEWQKGSSSAKAWEELIPTIGALLKVALALTDHFET